jgi:RNA polymerase sigma-70 factor (ECF subfamily)
MRESDAQLAQLYRRYGPTIYARCRRILQDEAAAEDATQETFLRVLRHLARTPDDREVLTWIYRIATNHCLNMLRDARRRPAALPAAPATSPEQSLADRDFVVRLLRSVPRKLAAVAWMHHVEGMPQGEVALVLGVSRRTVVNRLADFAGRVRRQMSGG